MKKTNGTQNNSIFDRASKAAGIWRRFRLPVYACIAVLFVAAAIPATKTWYAYNRAGKGAGDGVTSAEVAAGAMPYMLYVARPQAAPDIDQIDHVDIYSSSDAAQLNTFDAIFGGVHNMYTSAYVRMPIYGVPAGKNVKFTVTCQSDYLNSQSEIEKYISNIIQMSCTVIPTSVIAENATARQIYEDAMTYFQNNAASLAEVSFVDYTVTTQNGGKQVSVTGKKTEGTEKGISFTIPANQIQMVNDKAYVYFKIDYNEDLVYHYIRTSLWGTGGFKLGQTAEDDFAGTISSGSPMVYDLKDITMTILD